MLYAYVFDMDRGVVEINKNSFIVYIYKLTVLIKMQLNNN